MLLFLTSINLLPTADIQLHFNHLNELQLEPVAVSPRVEIFAMTIETPQKSARVQSNVYKELIVACENDAVFPTTGLKLDPSPNAGVLADG